MSDKDATLRVHSPKVVRGIPSSSFSGLQLHHVGVAASVGSELDLAVARAETVEGEVVATGSVGYR